MLKRVGKSGWLSEVVWHSTEESRARGLVSVFACAEVVAAVATYWAIYFAFDTTLHLYVSLCIAPFVLLRSEASIAEGHRLWRMWSNQTPEHRPSRRALAIAFYIAVGAAAGWGITIAIGPDANLLLILTLAAFAGTTASVALEVAAFRQRNVEGVSDAEQGPFALGPCLASAAMAADLVGSVRLWDVSLLLTPIILVPAWLVGLGVGFGLGALFAGLAIRLCSALRHLLSGIKALPSNWRRLMQVNDPFQPPELIPKIAEFDQSSSFAGWLADTRIEGGLGRWFNYLFLATWAVPAWMWRFSIKSTAWAFFPFIYIVRIPPAYKDKPGRTQLVTVRGTTRWDWAGALLAFGVLAGSAATLVVPELVQDLIGQRDPNRPLTPLHYILVIDWGAIRLFHCFLLPALMITVFLFFYIDELRKWSVDPMGWKVMAVITLMKVRRVLVLLYAPLMIEAFTYDVYIRCDLPWLLAPLEAVYGPVECAVP